MSLSVDGPTPSRPAHKCETAPFRSHCQSRRGRDKSRKVQRIREMRDHRRNRCRQTRPSSPHRRQQTRQWTDRCPPGALAFLCPATGAFIGGKSGRIFIRVNARIGAAYRIHVNASDFGRLLLHGPPDLHRGDCIRYFHSYRIIVTDTCQTHRRRDHPLRRYVLGHGHRTAPPHHARPAVGPP